MLKRRQLYLRILRLCSAVFFNQTAAPLRKFSGKIWKWSLVSHEHRKKRVCIISESDFSFILEKLFIVLLQGCKSISTWTFCRNSTKTSMWTFWSSSLSSKKTIINSVLLTAKYSVKILKILRWTSIYQSIDTRP